ncbi:DUF3021 domain-containing protein [Solibacillus sp. MA9]|uniref:DUF3021 domain-containing protein n=1 Tax=Solibacillus palustris TaxID=2908203 RepID=A0ABS9UHU9_9BACL|nr:DUF3021 domain-containing protein [Solibacillus sp. MA9]MCH7323917.1 DUF3021 domain-containing protein [Solibacillus sp. MA9]
MRFLRTLIISILISLSCSYIIMSSVVFTSNEVMNGQELLKEVIIAIGLGIAISIISQIFEVERIPFLGQLLLHILGILVCVFTAGYLGDWYDVSNVSTIIIVLVSTFVIYCGTWWIMKNIMKKDVDELNKTIKKRRGELK